MKKITLLFWFCLVTSISFAQNCGTCNVNITTNDTLTYSANSGQLICINSSGNFLGNITVNGGTVCVSGNFNPKSITINSGVIINNGNATLNTSVSFGSSFQLINNSGAILNVNGNLTSSSFNVTNSGIINVVANINNSGTITNSNIINCVLLSGSGTINDTGIINSN